MFKMNYAMPENREKYKLLSLKFEDKRGFSPLQAADILAYEVYRQLPKFVGIDQHPVREELKQLVPEGERAIKSWGCVNESELTRFAGIAQRAWQYHGRRPINEVAARFGKRAKSKR
jgi:hypothetical protein